MPTQVPPHATATSPASPAGRLDVGHGHRIYHEQAGTPDGVPVLLLHGGPGSASSPRQRDPFEPTRYRIVQFDQRGCGRSTPLGEIAHNHTDALIEDIEALREQLGIGRWLVAGGSWGAALALVYAARHREHVLGLLLRGTFLAERADLDWFFHGVSALVPQVHAEFLTALPRHWRHRVVTYLDRCLQDPERDGARTSRLVRAWHAYETRLDTGPGAPYPAPPAPDMERLVARYRVQAHYLARRCFLARSTVIQSAAALRGLPLALVHGSHDRVCRPLNAWRVHRACAGSRLAWAAGAGHNPWHPATAALLREAADRFAISGDFIGWPAASPGATA